MHLFLKDKIADIYITGGNMKKKTLKGYYIRNSVERQFREICKRRQRPASHIIEDMMIEWMIKAKTDFRDLEEPE